MFCKYCGSKLMDNAAFCHECGKATYEQPVCPPPVPPVSPTQPIYQQPAPPAPPVQPMYQQPAPPVPPVPPAYTYHVQFPTPTAPVQPAADQPQLEKLEQQTLTLGILGLCLSILGVPGIVLSSIAAKKAEAYKKLTGKVEGKVRTGHNLSKAGRAVGIVMTVVLTILVMALQGEVTYEYNDPSDYFSF